MAGRHRCAIVQLGTFNFLEQHRRNNRLAVLRIQCELRDEIGLRREKMNRRTFRASLGCDHDNIPLQNDNDGGDSSAAYLT